MLLVYVLCEQIANLPQLAGIVLLVECGDAAHVLLCDAACLATHARLLHCLHAATHGTAKRCCSST